MRRPRRRRGNHDGDIVRKGVWIIFVAILRTLIVLAAFGAALWGWQWSIRRRSGSAAPVGTRRIRRLDMLPMGPKRAILLVQIDQTVVALAWHEQGVTVIYQSPDDPQASPAATPESGKRLTIGEWLSRAAGRHADD